MIYIFIPQVSAEPIGGVQTLFDYAERLNELAEAPVARIICPAPYIRTILPRKYPLVPVSMRSPKLSDSDILIFPEVLASTIDQYPQANAKYLAVLNYGYFEVYARQSPKLVEQLTGFLTNSKYTATQLHKRYPAHQITHIPHVIEARFKITTPFGRRDQNSVLILNRKNTHHIPIILKFLENLPHKVTLVNNVSSSELLKLYNSHQVFINLGYPEGFCRPAAEAMACGCVVVGFTGGGGGDFMRHGQNSFIAEDGNERQLIELLSFVLYDLGKKELATVSQQASNSITQTYTKLAQAKQLYTVFSSVVSKSLKLKKFEQVYKNYKTATTSSSYKPMYTQVSKQTLELQLFNERQKYEELRSSKFYAIWQKYLEMKDLLKNRVSLTIR